MTLDEMTKLLKLKSYTDVECVILFLSLLVELEERKFEATKKISFQVGPELLKEVAERL